MMKLATVKNALFRGKVIAGTFPIESDFAAVSWAGKPRDGKITVIDNGTAKGLWVNKKDVSYKKGSEADVTVAAFTAPKAAKAGEKTVAVADSRSDSEIASDIAQRFSVMDRLTTGVIAGHIKSTIIAGAPGVGKSYELEAKLEKAEKAGKIDFTRMSGTVSGIGLYKTLYNYRARKNVVVLDDIDAIFCDQDALNVLKAALDTSKKRTITWMTESSALRNDDIPTSFEFEGSIVFITNMNFDKVMTGGSKIAPHICALMSRTVYLDLGIHTNREIMIRIEQVIKAGDMLADKTLSYRQKDEVIAWVRANNRKMRTLSLREVLHLADMVSTDPKGWMEIAEVTMLDPRKS